MISYSAWKRGKCHGDHSQSVIWKSAATEREHYTWRFADGVDVLAFEQLPRVLWVQWYNCSKWHCCKIFIPVIKMTLLCVYFVIKNKIDNCRSYLESVFNRSWHNIWSAAPAVSWAVNIRYLRMVTSASRPFSTAVNLGSLFGRRLNSAVTLSFRNSLVSAFAFWKEGHDYCKQKMLASVIPFLTGLRLSLRRWGWQRPWR